MDSNAQSVQLKAKFYRGLGDPSRLAIIEALCAGSATVNELVTATGLSQPNLSNHLRCLRECGLVLCGQEGRYVRCRLADARITGLLVLAEGLLADIANGVYQCTRYDDKPARGTGAVRPGLKMEVD